MRLIDADELMKDARRDKAISACLADIVDIQNLVNDQPTIDAVPVVRCKHCEYRMHHPDSYETLLCTHKHWAGEFLPVVTDDGFCNYGKRMEG